jgi:hypothetical protein
MDDLPDKQQHAVIIDHEQDTTTRHITTDTNIIFYIAGDQVRGGERVSLQLY